jgi:hypothetical protein
MSQSGVDFSKLTTPDKIVLGGAIAYFIWVFIPGWYSFEGVTVNGFRFPMILAWLLAAVAVAELVLRRFMNSSINLPSKPGTVHLAIAGAALVLTLLGLLIRPSVIVVTFGVSWALFVGIIIAAVWAYGAYMMYNEPESAMGEGPTNAPGGFTT